MYTVVLFGRTWDLRNPSHPVGVGTGHSQAVKRVRVSTSQAYLSPPTQSVLL